MTSRNADPDFLRQAKSIDGAFLLLFPRHDRESRSALSKGSTDRRPLLHTSLYALLLGLLKSITPRLHLSNKGDDDLVFQLQALQGRVAAFIQQWQAAPSNEAATMLDRGGACIHCNSD